MTSIFLSRKQPMHRPLMAQWADKKGPDGLEAYHRDKNLVSIDGFPTGLRVP